MLMKAVLWIAIGLAMLALTHFTFRFGDVTMKPSKRAARRRDAQYAQQH
jgi:hypothetical protein